MSNKTKNIATVLCAAVFLFGLSLWCLLKSAEDFSISERRPLAQAPVLSGEALRSGEFMESFEDYAVDQFPARDQFRMLKSYLSLYLLQQGDVNDIYLSDGYVSKLDYPLHTDSIEYAASRFAYIADRYLQDADIYLSVIPDKNYFLAEKNGYPAADYEALTRQLRAQLPDMEYVDIFGTLTIEDYYRTDTHWRQEALKDTAQVLAQAMGVSLSQEYEEKSLPRPFYGVYYGQSALPLPADTLRYLTNDTLARCTVYDYESGQTVGIYDFDRAEGNDPYELFLSGSRSLLKITNPDAQTDRRLVVFRDSFGSSLVPLLVEGYAEITLIDVRYIAPEMLANLVDFTDCDALFLYSTLVLNNSITLK